MTTTQGNLASLSRFIFRTPSWYSSASFALAVAALTGIAVFDSAFVLDDAWQGLFFIGLPTVVAGLATATVDQRLGGRLTPDRATLLALACEVLVVAVLLGAGTLARVTQLAQPFVFDALLVALAAIFALRLLVIMAVSHRSALVAAVPASIQTGVAAVLLFVYSGALSYFEVGGSLTARLFVRPDEAPAALVNAVRPADFVLLAVMCVLHGLAVWGFLTVVDIPWRRGLDVSVFEFIQGFIGHLAEGTRELETFFESIGEDALVPVTVLSVRRTDGTEKARFVLPMLHPGPMGDIGGGSLPTRIAEDAEGLGFPPHATAGHDFNLVTEREVDTVCDVVDRITDDITDEAGATGSVRIEEGDVAITGQAVGNGGLAVATYSPSCTDDISYSVGLAGRAAARSGGLEDVCLIDAHNCNDGLDGEDLGHVTPGSQRAFDLIDGAERLGEELTDRQREAFALGTAWDPTPWEPRDGIGPLGVRVAVFEVGDQQTAYVLVDGNNMEPGLRDRIVDAVETVDRIAVMTSDTHVVNTVDAENQVGQNLPTAELVDLIEDLVAEAAADCEPVTAGMATETAEVTIFGNDRTETLASHANAMVSMGSALALAVGIAVISTSVLIFLLAQTLA